MQSSPEGITQEDLAAYREAGRIAKDALAYGKAKIAPGVRVRDVLDDVEGFIAKRGGLLAFPAQSSINAVAAHACPEDDDDISYAEGDIVKLDVGVHLEGLIADTACSVALSGPDAEHVARMQSLIDASRAALDAALPLATPGTPLWKIGAAIEAEIERRGFKPVRNLSGHGLERYEIHAAPSVPNFNSHTQETLHEGQVIAIEPFSTTGVGLISAQGDASIFNVETLHPVRNPYAREVLRVVGPLEGLPFSFRMLTRALGDAKARFGVTDLLRQEVLAGHAPLVERSGGMVAQSEHSVIVARNPLVFTRDDDTD